MFIEKKLLIPVAIISIFIASSLISQPAALGKELKPNLPFGHGPATSNMLTKQQQADLEWYLTERNKLIAEVRKNQVEVGIITPKALDAYLVAMNERKAILLSNGGIAPKLTLAQYQELQLLQNKFKQSSNQEEKVANQKEIMQYLIEHGLMTNKEYRAHMTIVKEVSKLQAEYKKHPEGMAYRERQTQQAAFNKEFTAKLKQLNHEYIEKRVLNGSLSRTDADQLLKNPANSSEKIYGFARNQSGPLGVMGHGPTVIPPSGK